MYNKKVCFPVSKEYIFEFHGDSGKINLITWEEYERQEMLKVTTNKNTKKVMFPEINKISAVVIPTYNCNLKCEYCYEGSLTWLPHKITTKHVEMIFSFLKKYSGDRNIYWTITGGEPLLPSVKKEVLYLLKKIKNRGETVTVITNGMFIDGEYLRYIDSFQITLDGTREIHNKRRHDIKGRGSFEKVLQGIESALNAGKDVIVRVNIDAQNIDNIPALIRELEKRGYFKFKNFSIYAYPISESGNPNYPYIVDELSLVKRAVYLIRKYPSLKKIKWSFHGIGFFEEVLQSKAPPTAKVHFCSATLNQFVFDPYGYVYTCWYGVGKPGFKIGSYYPDITINKELLHRWNNRNSLNMEKCIECPFQFICGGGCAYKAYVETGNFENPRCTPILEILEEWIPLLLENLNIIPKQEPYESEWDFERWAESYDSSLEADDWIHSDYKRVLKEVSKRIKGKVVVDIGAGTGNILRYLNRGTRYIGIEPSPNMRRIFRKKHSNIEIFSGHFLNIPLPDNFADTVISTYAFHHVPPQDKERGILEISRILKDAGTFIIADVMFLSESEKLKIGEEDDILDEILDEYFVIISDFQKVLDKYNIKYSLTQINRYVWILEGRV